MDDDDKKQREPGNHLWVNGVVAVRNGMPYMQISNEHGIVAQLDMPQARQVAADLLQMSARTEIDAMVVKVFAKMDLCPTARWVPC